MLASPVVQFEDMAQPASGSLSVACGDFREAYYIIDRNGFSMISDPYTQAPNYRFVATKRVGGGVVMGEALKLLALS